MVRVALLCRTVDSIICGEWSRTCFELFSGRADQLSVHDTALKDAGLDKVDAGDLDDGLPRGFLAGAIVKMWVALCNFLAGEFPRRVRPNL